MSLKRTLLTGGGLLTATSLADGAMRFGRILIVANVLLKEDYGIAALFAMTLMLLTAVSELGLERLIVQNPRGAEDRFMRTVHLFFLVRGFLLAGVIYLLAGPIAGFLNVPEATWAFELLALQPLIAGLTHMDYVRVQRDLCFRSHVLVTMIPSVVTTLLAFPLVRLCPDYSALLYMGLMQAVVRVVVSHVVAERKYRLGYEASLAPTIWRFGWPVLLNSVLMILILEGDKFLIAHSEHYDKAMLAEFNIAFLLTLEPMMVVARVADKLLLPVLSGMGSDRERFLRHYGTYSVLYCGIAAGFGAFFGLAGYALLSLLFGDKYLGAVSLLALLGIQHGLRLTRYGPTVAAIALGDTRSALAANVMRLMGVLGALVVAWNGAPLEWMVVMGIGGEVAAIGVMLLWLKIKEGISPSLFAQPFVLTGACLALFGGLGGFWDWEIQNWLRWGLCLGAWLITLGVFLACFNDLRVEFFNAVYALGRQFKQKTA
jgi:O-antigen/teichoic acid export membrane protein